jgi:hypothetical protein
VGSPSPEAPRGATEGTAAAAPAQAPAYTASELSASEHDRAAHAAGQTVEAPGERRLESRGSEAIDQAMEAVEPSAVSGEISASPGAQQAALHLGSPAAQSEAKEASAAEIAAARTADETPPAAQVSSPAGPPHASPAPEKVEPEKAGEPKGEKPKTFFRLWLDLAFGRKR